MICPRCGSTTGGVGVKVGIVKVSTHKCFSCGKLWREKVLLVEFCPNAVEKEISRIKRVYPAPSPQVKAAVRYLECRLSEHALSNLSKSVAGKKRRADAWERKFLKDAIGEDYYSEVSGG